MLFVTSYLKKSFQGRIRILEFISTIRNFDSFPLLKGFLMRLVVAITDVDFFVIIV